MSIVIVVEGGSQGSAKSGCRKAFRAFFEKVIPRGSFKVIASGSRRSAYEDFCLALRQDTGDYIVLLVDSEDAVAGGSWQHLATRRGDRWPRPAEATDEQAHLMVQAMEAWFLADRHALMAYYGQDFTPGSLPRQANIELISKRDVFRALKQASRNTRTKGEYHKTKHGFDLLERIDPRLVRTSSTHAAKLLDVLEGKAAQ